MRKLLAVLVAGLLLTLPVLAKETVYTDDARGFQLTVPDGWTANRWDSDSIAVKVASPDGIEAGGVYVLIYPVQGRSLDGYARAMEEHILKDMDGNIISQSRTMISGRPAVHMVYDGNAVGVTGDPDRRFMRSVVFTDDQIYVIHAVAVPGQFGDYEAGFRRIMESFQLL
ncbi:MAG: hypothetical protein HY319_14290 [Armatimonadetes bacterium]|nr:hypothetical protein [Armatimonadota bacterium]